MRVQQWNLICKRHSLQLIAFVMLLIMIPSGLALEQCTNTPKLNKNCTFVTPPLFCSSNTYDVINNTGVVVVDDGSLSVHENGNNLYEFNFTLTTEKADYTVVLCDGSYRELNVGGGLDGMSIAFLIALPLLIAGLLQFIANGLDPEEHLLVKVVFSLFGMLMPLFSIWFGFIVQDQLLGSTSLESALATFLWIFGIVLFGLFAYMFLYLIRKYLLMSQEHKESQLRY